jgi:hypothetical protein
VDQDKLKNLIYRHTVAAKDIPAADAAKIVKLLNSKDAELIERLSARYAMIEADGFDKGPATTKRLEEIRAMFAELNSKVYELSPKGLPINSLIRRRMKPSLPQRRLMPLAQPSRSAPSFPTPSFCEPSQHYPAAVRR